MSKSKPTIWSADAHTIAKIAILKGYLKAWLRILGTTRRGQTILYVDGFAGPGHYKNHEEGSPLAALRVAEAAINELGTSFIARKIECAFIEASPARFEELEETVAPFEQNKKLGVTKIHDNFELGLQLLRKEFPGPFRGEGPLFVFADPFGATGIPLHTFADCMKGDTAELLINLDADGIGRIFAADNKNREEQLTSLFGDESWRTALTAIDNFKRLSVQILDLYKNRLRSLPGVKFVWSFAMRGRNDSINYYLVFATKHPLGMEKMKEAMRAIDKTGTYSFSDAHIEQHVLFGDADAEIYAKELFQVFNGRAASLEEVNIFALNETPFLNAKAMLALLEKRQQLRVEPYDGEQRRAGSFAEGKVRELRFGQFGAITSQGELF